MKLATVLIIIAAILATAMGTAMAAKPPAEGGDLWKKVTDAQNKGLPQTAIDVLKEIHKNAVAAKKHGEALRALCMMMVFEANIKGNKAEEKITRLEEEIPKADEAMRPLMNIVLAQWYWHYFNNNSWRFMERTQTAGLSEKDFTTWDLPKLFSRISAIHQEILKESDKLKKINISEFNEVLEMGNLPQALQPTLFDFASNKALEFYESGQQAAAAPQDAFDVRADSDAFAAAAKFMQYKPDTTDLTSPKLMAIKIYQGLLDFHANDAAKDAFVDIDLRRLSYIKNVASGENISDVYITRLKEIAAEYKAIDLSALAKYYWAQELNSRGELVEALKMAQEAEKDYPQSAGGMNGRTLAAQILAKNYSMQAERAVPSGQKSKLSVSYKNIDTLTFRAVADNWEEHLKENSGRSFSWMDDPQLDALLKKKPAAEWTVSVAPTPDYKEKKTVVEIPELPKGFYRIFASNDKGFSKSSNRIAHCYMWVSDISVVTRERDGRTEGFVVNSVPGTPAEGATVKIYSYHSYYSGRQYVRKCEVIWTGKTDKDGFFSVAQKRMDDYGGMMVYASDGKGSEYFDPQESYPYDRGTESPSEQAFFFTDRSIYRPGQQIQFKGVCVAYDRERNKYEILKGRSMRVYFRDPNGQEITTANFTTNDFGSFAGSFNAPVDRATGQMTIGTDGPYGQCGVRVEEYKRPKFTVDVKIPEEGFKLGDSVTVKGEAMAYTGAPIDGALVKYRVTRRAMMPYWWYFCYYGPSPDGEQEIAHGKAKTDAEGKFEIKFTAKPDTSISKSDEPTFTYQISADVTDTAGETRSDMKSIRLGYTAMEAKLSAAEWLAADSTVEIKIDSTTLDGKAIAAEGQIEIFELAQPAKPVKAELSREFEYYWWGRTEKKDDGDKALSGNSETANWQAWPAGNSVEKKGFSTDGKKAAKMPFHLKPGAYKAVLTTNDRFGNKVTAFLPFMVIDPKASKFGVRTPNFYVVKDQSVEAGDKFTAFWGTGYDTGRAFVEILHRGQYVKRYWTAVDATTGLVEVPVSEDYRGGFTVMMTYIRENRLYTNSTRVDVPWSNKAFSVAFETFRSKLLPGQDETWTIKIKGPGAERTAAEFVAALYDESLDAFCGHGFGSFNGLFRSDYSSISNRYSNVLQSLSVWVDGWQYYPVYATRNYINFKDEIVSNYHGYGFPGGKMRSGHMKKAMRRDMDNGDMELAGAAMEESKSFAEAPPPPAPSAQAADAIAPAEKMKEARGEPSADAPAQAPATGANKPDLSKVAARKNLNETAFFFPQLLSDENGTVKITFKMPEALTKWKFLGFAHGRGLECGNIEEHAVTQKDLMVQPNPPRFMREGDILEFAVKVTNMVDKEVKGTVRLTLSDPVNLKPVDDKFGNTKTDIDFTIPAKQSQSFSFKLTVPDGVDIVNYKAVASTGDQSDGEENVLPILSRRIFVQESIPLPIRGPQEKKFKFEKLAASGKSDTLKHKGFTIQMTSNPSWYAVQALPFLMEFPHECSEQIFNRLYANALAKHIADSDPKIRRVFDLWKGTDALLSNLEKNEQLKSVMLLETPWVRQAKSETEAKRNVGILFDDNRLNAEIKGAFEKLSKMQLPDGNWPWFPGGYKCEYITLYIVTGFGRLKNLEVNKVSFDPAVRALQALDEWIDEIYRNILKYGHKNENNLTSTIALYLYGRSFFLKDQAIAPNSKEAVEYFLGQAREYWLKLDNRLSQGHLALALKRFGDEKTPKDIMKSIKERSQKNEEMGMFWGETELSWWWYRAPIETQALMIEAFAEIENDAAAVEECKVWLLKQKQTQNWKTTTATADSIYALLCRGDNLLASDALVEVSVGGKKVEPAKVEAGTGFYEKRYDGAEVKPEFGDITVKKTDKGVAWGGAHWQYMEDMSKVTPHVQNNLTLKKTIFVKRDSKAGPVIEPMAGVLEVGDLVTIRIELRVDRDMEFVHMKDQRGSGLEPVNVLSQYKYQDGLRYYESTKDTATHFYIDYLPKGTYVFEYGLRVQHRGKYQNGMANIECMYAPEFNSHSDSVMMEVK